MKRGWVLLLFCAACTATATPFQGSATPAPLRATAGTAASSTATLPPPSPTATETLGPPLRFFQEDFNGGLGHWRFLQVDNGQPAVAPEPANGFLTFDLREPNLWVYEIYDPQKYTDVRVDARVEFRSAELGVPGVICRYDEGKGWYEFDIHPDQTYVILFGQWLAAGVARFTPLVQAGSEKIRPDENEIGLLCEGDTLTPFINGTQIRRRQEQLHALTGGMIGISASSFEKVPVALAYDWVKVSQP